MFEKRHYVAIARVLQRLSRQDKKRSEWEEGYETARRRVVSDIAEAFQIDNSNFKPATFRETCEKLTLEELRKK